MTKDTHTSDNHPLQHLTLGKSVTYSEHYDPGLLQAVPRSISRDEIALTPPLPFNGFDIWTGYELSWLTPKGKPQVAILSCDIPCSTPNLVESKSFKLYLNSFNQHRVENVQQLQDILTRDLSACAGGPVRVKVIEPQDFGRLEMREMAGVNIDHLDVDIDHYVLDPSHLRASNIEVEETLTSNLLKSNCLITNQPDWASVQIRYQGPQIEQAGLLRYLISFRQHNEFHEQCVERIFRDILHSCKPNKLSVYARYTRRGGLDINPFRSNFEQDVSRARQARQ